MNDLLAGVTVVESASLLVGDHLGMLLGDQGADVIKIEQPGIGDYLRKILGQFAPDYSPMHVMANRNKRSLTVNTKLAEGKEILERLIGTADVFITGNVGDIPRRLGIDYESLKAIKPDLIYCQVTGYGAEGPYAPVPTHGLMMEALGGAPELSMGPNGRVQEDKPGISQSGVIAGPLFAAYGIAAALYRRERTGQGAYLDISCSDAVIASAWPSGTAKLNADLVQAAEDVATFPVEGMKAAAKYTYYQTKDEQHILFCAIEKKFWDVFCIEAGRPDLCDRHSTVTVVDYGENDFDLMDELQALFLTKTSAEWMEIMIRRGLPAGPAVNIDHVRTDPHLQAREIIVSHDHPAVGTVSLIGSPLKVDHGSFSVRRHAPALGEHTEEVLHELGFNGPDIDRFSESGAI